MNKKYNIYYLPIARKDLVDIIEYIQADNPNAALNFLDQFENTISKLEDFPYMGATPKDIFFNIKAIVF